MRRTAQIISIFAVLAITATAGAVVAGFPDVPDDHVHANGIAWAAENGLMVGYDNGNFGPEDPVTRGQLSTIFLRYDERLDDSGSGGGTQGPRGPAGPPGAAGAPGAPGAPGTDAQVTAQVGIGVIPILDGLTIGGPIADNHTPLPGATLSLAAGDYMIEVYGAFEIPGDGGAPECDLFPGVDIWPQLTFWIDQDASGTYNGGEGLISPNVLMPNCNGRHANVSGQIVISLDATTSVGLIAFGYTSTGGTEGTGDIQGGGGLIASPLGSLTFGGASQAFDFFGEGGE
jgi:S-layer homology domain